jgi:HEAT repeat protein
MAGKHKFERQVAALDALRELPPEACVAPLRQALAQRNNFLAAKAADLVREFRLPQLIPELLTAFDRFFEDATKTDPQCWAKNALSRALADLDHQDAATFLRGMRHIQLEPVWGGRSDTAATLRANCALALVQCRSLPDAELLAHLVDLLGDKEKVVRVEAIHAIEQVGAAPSALLLRLRAMVGADEPEVLGAAYGGILRLEGFTAIPWVSRFLNTEDDSAAEAALAIAATHSPQGFHSLRERLADASDPWFRSVVLSAIALTRQDEAIAFLLELVRTESLDAEGAIEALVRALPSDEVIRQLEAVVIGNPRLVRVFATHRNASAPRLR